MLKALSPLIGAALLTATTVLYAQPSTPADAGKGGRHFDCSQAKDPKACQERREAGREKMKAAHEKAAKACEGQKGDAHRDCMRKSMCAEAKDPAKCEARAQNRMQRHEQGEKK
jgi:hypothetical protein